MRKSRLERQEQRGKAKNNWYESELEITKKSYFECFLLLINLG